MRFCIKVQFQVDMVVWSKKYFTNTALFLNLSNLIEVPF